MAAVRMAPGESSTFATSGEVSENNLGLNLPPETLEALQNLAHSGESITAEEAESQAVNTVENQLVEPVSEQSSTESDIPKALLDDINLSFEDEPGLAATKADKKRLGGAAVQPIIVEPAKAEEATVKPSETVIVHEEKTTPLTTEAPRPVPRPPTDALSVRPVPAWSEGEKSNAKESSKRAEREQQPPRTERHPTQHAKSLHDEITSLTRALERKRTQVAAREKPAPKTTETKAPTEPTIVPTVETVPEAPVKRPTATEKAKAWGLTNKRSKESYEAYLAQRPSSADAEAFRTVDKNGNDLFYAGNTGKRVKSEEYEEVFDRSHRAANDYYDEKNEPRAMEKAHEEAVSINEAFDRNTNEVIRQLKEGELLVQSEPKLRALHELGIEIKKLKNSKVSPEEYSNQIVPALESKKLLYGMVYEKLESDGADQRALDFIANDALLDVSTGKDGAIKVDVEDRKSTKGAAFVDGRGVSILDVVETPDGSQKAYTIEEDDGSIRSVFADEVTFKREYETAKTGKEKRSTREKLSDALTFMKTEFTMFRRLGGMAYYSDATPRAWNWLKNRGIDEETMSYEQIQKQRQINRRNNLIGTTAALLVGGATARLFIDEAARIFDDLVTQGSAAEPTLGATEFLSVNEAPVSGGFDKVNDVIEAATTIASTTEATQVAEHAEALSNAAYNIPSGEGGYQLFSNLGLDAQAWDANASALAEKFPNDFRFVNNGVQISHSGWISTEAREYIESLR